MGRLAFIIAGSLLVSSAAAQASQTITYSYDARGRLVTVQHTGTVNNAVTTTYAFDAADNRLAKTTSGVTPRIIVVPSGEVIVIPITS